jgi:hypothetical protein
MRGQARCTAGLTAHVLNKTLIYPPLSDIIVKIATSNNL